MFEDFQTIRKLPPRLCWTRSELARYCKVSRTTTQIAEAIALVIPDFARLHQPCKPLNGYQAWVIASIAFVLKKLHRSARGSSYRNQLAQALKSHPTVLSWESYQDELYPHQNNQAA